MRADLRLALLLACFALSGFAALLYETAWTRQFTLVFGASDLAVATVLAAYFAGLAAGAAAAARLAPRIRRPVAAYAALELGIGAAALAVPLAIAGARWLHVLAFGGADALPEAGGLAPALFYLGCSFAILLVPTGLMGATLPLLARHAVRRSEELGPRVGALYAANTAGAVAGTLCTAFWLLPAVGLQRTILAGVATNGLVFLAAAALARGAAPPAEAASPARAASAGPARWILPLMLASGAASFGYEVLWTRLLGHVLGGSVYAFATMLASFLLGIALGSAAARRLASTPGRAAAGFAAAQLGTALLSWAAFASLDRLPALAARLGASGGAGLLAHAGVAGAVLLPGALFIGATFPLAVRVLARSEAEAGPASGRVYAWNTVGATLGAVGTGFFVLPALGFAGTLALAVLTNLALGAAALGLRSPLPRALALAIGLATAAFFLMAPGDPGNVLRSSPIASGQIQGEVVFYAVGRSSTALLADDGAEWRLRTNGLPEAKIRRPGVRPRAFDAEWLGKLPVLARPDARSMLVVGLGGGITVEGAPETLSRIDVVELEPEVIAANRHVGGLRADDPLADPRVHLYVNDARSALLLTRRRYDVIVSQPSHPWTAGAAQLYTREFFELARSRLAEGGVFAQWMGLSFVDEPLLRSLLATLADVFQHVRLYWPEPQTLHFLASDAPLATERDAARAIAASPAAFARAGVLAPEDVALVLALDEEAVRRFAAGAPIATDDRNLLEMHSPRALRAPLGGARLAELLAPFDRLAADASGLQRRYLVRRLAHQPARAERVAQAAADPVERAVCAGIAKLAARERAEGLLLLGLALAQDPLAPGARFALAQEYRRRGIGFDDPGWLEVTRESRDPAAAVFEGWRLREAGDWAALRGLEPRLAGAGPTDDEHPEAVRLRAEWRLHAGDPALAREGRELLDRILPAFGTHLDMGLRAELAAAAGEPYGALASLGEALEGLRPSPRTRELARRAVRLRPALPDEESPQRARLEARIARLLGGER